MNELVWFRLSSTSVFPRRAKQGDAGYDLVADEAACIPPHGRVEVTTNVGVLLPRQTYGRVAPHSGLALKHGIDVLAGVVNQGYRDGIKVILLNTDEKQAYTVERGDKIAQLILERCVDQNEIAHEQQLSLDEAKQLPQFASERGTCDLGSTDERMARLFTQLTQQLSLDEAKQLPQFATSAARAVLTRQIRGFETVVHSQR